MDLKNASNSKIEGDKFVEKLEPFLAKAQEQYDILNTMFKQMDNKYTELAKYYTFDRKKYSSGEFLNDLKEFQHNFQVFRCINFFHSDFFKKNLFIGMYQSFFVVLFFFFYQLSFYCLLSL